MVLGSAFVGKHLLNFNFVILVVFTFQNATSVLLSSYTQQRYSGADASRNYTPMHLLMAVEMCKLLFSIVWHCFDARAERIAKARVQVTEGAVAEAANSSTTICAEVADDAADVEVIAVPILTHEPGKPTSPIARQRHGFRIDAGSLLWRLLERAQHAAAALFGGRASPPSPASSLTASGNGVSESLRDSPKARSPVGGCRSWCGCLTRHVNFETLLMAVPAVAYAIQNMFILDSLAKLHPIVYQITFQFRILMMAVAMRVIMKTAISPKRWLALCVLFVGVVFGQLGAAKTERKTALASVTTTRAANVAAVGADGGAEAAAALEASARLVSGLTSLFLGCCISVLTAVYMEAVFKKRANNAFLSTRNIHLAFFSIVYFSMLSVREYWQLRVEDDEGTAQPGTFHERPGWTALTHRGTFYAEGKMRYSSFGGYVGDFFLNFDALVWLLVCVNAFGGLLIALIMRYSDNIMKTLSTAAAIVVSGVGSYFIFDTHLSGMFLFGAALVLFAVCMYNLA